MKWMTDTAVNRKKGIAKAALYLVNIVLMLAAVLCTVFYSGNVRDSQDKIMRESFCNTVETMKQLSVRYLSGEYEKAESWAAYIEKEHMTMAEAMDYVRTVSNSEECEAHFVDMDTFEAWTTNPTGGVDTIGIYAKYYAEAPGNLRLAGYVERMREMYAGEKNILGKYNLAESMRNVISVGLPVTLRQENGADRVYLVLRVVPVDRMKELWLFPVNYSKAEIGLIAQNCDYVIPSYSMRSENFIEFVRGYNFQDDYNGADALLAQLQEQDSGLLMLKDSKKQMCYWYYSSLEEFAGLDILGYIPVSELSSTSDNVSIVIVVAGIMLLLALIDGWYILNINRKLRATAKVAENASQAKTQFLSTMSHDIRTPLNAVLGMTELAQSHMEDPNYVRECLRKISFSGNHLLTLINDILEISRVESGKIVLNPTALDVRELAAGLESICRSQAVGHGLTMKVSVRELPQPYLLGDKLRLTQVYLNLLNNAIKYTESGGTVTMEMWEEPLEEDRVNLVCVVRDTGIGMSKEFQKTMYDSFTRVADSRIDKIQGTGLGLSIVKQMVTLMKGTIDCVSDEGMGSVFTVRIPLKATTAPDALHRGEDAEQTGSVSDLHGIRVLVAEDNDLNWEISSELLSGFGIVCERAENGRECVNRLMTTPPHTFDLVLMDVQMPVLNGREATRELRSGDREDLRTIPIIAMTADAFAEDVQMCLDAGMDAHVAKPIEVDKVLAKIRLLLARRNHIDGRKA